MNKPIYVGLATAKMSRLIIASILLVVAGRVFNAGAQTETNLHSFGSSPTDGRYPQAGLVQGSDGNFYGTTLQGGTNTNCRDGCGTVFRISPSGSNTTLYSFAGSPNDGNYPGGVLVQGSDGNFYGTSFYGGTSANCNGGCGTVFRISPSGSEMTLYSFVGSTNDGFNPSSVLVQGGDGNFYGTTYSGGTNGDGTVFRISPSGSETNLHIFGGQPNDGYAPNGLVQGSDGNFYGTAQGGGTQNHGTVFRISPNGSYTNLYSFGGPHDGGGPEGVLVHGSDGNFYGTTQKGGTNDIPSGGRGTVFRISPDGSYTNLYSFGSSPSDGTEPQGGVVQGSDGNFYGTTEDGGTNDIPDGGLGTVFRITPNGSYTSLYSFGSPNDGYYTVAGLVQGSDGNFYGTTQQGGTNNYGTVFKLTVPLNPPPYPINQITGVQVSETNIVFTIPSIAYETYQLQFSSSMTPTNWINVPVSVTNSIGALLTVTNFGGASQPQGFYRFDITP